MWLIEKIRETVESSFSCEDQRSPDKDNNGNTKEKITRLPNNVLTPEMIPDFFIPPTFSSNSVSWQKKLTLAQKSSVLDSDGESFPKFPLANFECMYKMNSNEGAVRLSSCRVIQTDNTEEKTINEYQKEKEFLSALPSLSVHQGPAYYGILSLRGSPHTRRKESLFHVDVINGLQQRQVTLNKKCINSVSLQPCLLSPPELPNIYKTSSNEGIADCGSPPSSDSSPFSSPLLPKSLSRSSLFKLFTHCNASDEESISISKQFLERKSSPTDEWDSTDNSPSSSIKTNFLPPAVFSFDFLQCKERLQKEHTVSLDRRGIVRLSAEYNSCSVTLRVRVIAAEDLYEKSFKAKNVSCLVIMYLIPGKVQRQQSTIIKNSKNPIFNEDFFFDAVIKDDLKSMSLKIKVINKCISIKVNTVLGEKIIPLSELMPF
ncbi:C2 calcium-dependent domain-containing protein 4C-like [Rhinatrema bivittatum]|uniref:C2 calcium-dependent domain-containing protein 4C-like n=1 Tax=Rhinatrema bivittatum TaxID=194408 RepID=UPI001126BC73|nr:C2 calcium-dependent domain-containing protein 4C-like [Rhinatrema bivittatum]